MMGRTISAPRISKKKFIRTPDLRKSYQNPRCMRCGKFKRHYSEGYCSKCSNELNINVQKKRYSSAIRHWKEFIKDKRCVNCGHYSDRHIDKKCCSTCGCTNFTVYSQWDLSKKIKKIQLRKNGISKKDLCSFCKKNMKVVRSKRCWDCYQEERYKRK